MAATAYLVGLCSGMLVELRRGVWSLQHKRLAILTVSNTESMCVVMNCGWAKLYIEFVAGQAWIQEFRLPRRSENNWQEEPHCYSLPINHTVTSLPKPHCYSMQGSQNRIRTLDDHRKSTCPLESLSTQQLLEGYKANGGADYQGCHRRRQRHAADMSHCRWPGRKTSKTLGGLALINARSIKLLNGT